jgi:hypothetical protein
MKKLIHPELTKNSSFNRPPVKSAQVVPIQQVISFQDGGSSALPKVIRVLVKQGQIEPLQVWKFENHYIVHGDGAYDDDILWAALALGWSTLLILDTPHYIP